MIAILCAIERPNPVLMIAVVGDKNSRRIRAVTHKIQ
jgi:hypothetical protein